MIELAGHGPAARSPRDCPARTIGRVFDPTGLVKGWAVQQAFDDLFADPALRDHDALINAGGDIAVHCRRTDTPDWTIAIEDPRDRQRAVCGP